MVSIITMKAKKKKTQTMTATTARKQFFELLDAAYYQGLETILTKNGKKVARIVPIEEEGVDWDAYLKKIKNFKPFLTDEDVKEIEDARKSFNKPRFPDW